MDLKPITNKDGKPSSQIRAADYNPVLAELYIEFQNGAVYRYDKVPQKEYDGLLRAESAGRYFNVAIRACYEYEKVKEADPKPEGEKHGEAKSKEGKTRTSGDDNSPGTGKALGS